MGEKKTGSLRVGFDSQLKLEFHGAKVTSDAGLLTYRELDNALGLTAMAGEVLHDTRTGVNVQHSVIALLRQSVYGRVAGYEGSILQGHEGRRFQNHLDGARKAGYNSETLLSPSRRVV